jgi:hypothetical protein
VNPRGPGVDGAGPALYGAAMQKPKGTHGGRRHGLDDEGRTKASRYTLGRAAEAALVELAGSRGLTRSEVLRRLVLDPGAGAVVDRAER